MELLINGPNEGPVYILAHGAGADMNSDFLTQVAEGLALKGIRVVRFNFPYMIKSAHDGKRRPPDRAPKLLAAYQDVIEKIMQQTSKPLVIGGKSMGGRIATMLTEQLSLGENDILGTACIGFPFHAPKKESKDRLDYLVHITKPVLIFQGTRDVMGNKEEVTEYQKLKRIDCAIKIYWLEDGDHDLKPRKASGFNHQQHINNTIEQLAEYVLTLHKQ